MMAKATTVSGQNPEVSEGGTWQPGSADDQRPGSRPLRADAVKNRARILEAAEDVFATEGVSVPIDVVAERAGLGVGTLYRHFPTKEALYEAIVATRLDLLLDTIRTLGGADDAGHASAKKDLFDALLSAGIDIKTQCTEKVDEIKGQIDQLRRRAVASGAVRSDVSADEMVGLVLGACQTVGHAGFEDATLQRMVQIVCDGLRVPVTQPRSS
jgi:AcrR family transcriptional regulator